MVVPDATQFDDIRPYYDHEVRSTLDRVLNDKEMISAVTRFRFPVLTSVIPFILKPLVRWFLRKETREVRDVKTFQDVVKKYMDRMIARTTTQLTHTGIEKLDKRQSYLFISNHRDIAMDPAFVNMMLYQHGMGTARIAIGDNLLTKPYASDLMRMNKSFLVNRSETAPKKLLVALKKLSAYIHYSLSVEKSNLWIAQREGRAKDGLDRTEPAIIKMITLAKPKDISFADYIRSLHIVPVAISYEWDPCDIAKANELHAKRAQGSYQKGEHEDVQSIARGISGFKGNVHVAFGDVLNGDYADADAVAVELDRQILKNYRLHATNYAAHALVADQQYQPLSKNLIIKDLDEKRPLFERRVKECPAESRDILIAMYANPVISKKW
jgi:1-acyl-sn-glycerol-3-phosphate acyltransferase